jgi:hypothetical protein
MAQGHRHHKEGSLNMGLRQTQIDDSLIRLDDEPQIVALRYLEGKNVKASYPGGRVMFSTVDSRRFFVNDDEANQLEHALVDQQIQAGENIAISRIQHGRGGGFSIRVARTQGSAPPPPTAYAPPPTPSQLEQQMTATLAQQRRQPERAITPQQQPTQVIDSAAAGINATTARLCAAFMSAIDAMAEARKYSQRSGYGDVVFNAEDLRAVALTAFIQQERAR